MNKRHYEHTLPNIRGSLSNTYKKSNYEQLKRCIYEKNLICALHQCSVLLP